MTRRHSVGRNGGPRRKARRQRKCAILHRMDTTAPIAHTPLWTLPQGYGVSAAQAITFTAAELATGRQQRDAQGNLR